MTLAVMAIGALESAMQEAQAQELTSNGSSSADSKQHLHSAWTRSDPGQTRKKQARPSQVTFIKDMPVVLAQYISD